MDGNLTAFETAFAGGLSGFATRFTCQPLDVLKILFQLQVEPRRTQKYKSIPQAITVIVKEEGIGGLWKGHVPAQVLSVLFGAVQFCTYEKIVSLSKHMPERSALSDSTSVHFFAGSVAGVAAITAAFPFDVLRTRLVAQQKTKDYKGVFYIAHQIMKKEGPRGFFKGLLPACIHMLPSSGLVFGFKHLYDRTWTCLFCDEGETHRYLTKVNLITGLLSGLSSKLIVYPLDVIKKRMQVQGMDQKNASLRTNIHYNGFLHCITLTLKNEGFMGLYRGIVPAMMKAGMANSIYFTMYYEICYLLELAKR